MENVEIGKYYYFNNRAVLILKQETEEMYLVCGNHNIDHDVTGSQWCWGCNVGDRDNKLQCTCADVNEVIEEIMDQISDKNVFWVSKKYIQEQPFEFEKHEKILNAIKENEAENKKLQDEIKDAKYLLGKMSSDIGGKKGELQLVLDEIERSKAELYELKADKERGFKQLSEIKDCANGQINITAKQLLSFIQDSIKLNALECGGVDNWTWYGESIDKFEEANGDIEDASLRELAQYVV